MRGQHLRSGYTAESHCAGVAGPEELCGPSTVPHTNACGGNRAIARLLEVVGEEPGECLRGPCATDLYVEVRGFRAQSLNVQPSRDGCWKAGPSVVGEVESADP